tara:strand:- start:285 stop:1409 length:1125 start_codon:yes stop_codon:yes gene_type:complete
MLFQFRVVILTMILSRSPCVCSSSTGGKKPQKQRVRRQSQRDQRDPADFNNDYDLLREHLQRENGGPIANFLNFLSENSFGNALNKSDNTNPFAFCYSWFLANVMPLKRQRQGLAGEAVSRATIRDEADRRLDEFILRLERDEKLKEDVARVKTFWLETATNRSSSSSTSSSSSSSSNNNNGNMTERYAENLACRTLSLAERMVSSTEQNTSENQDEVAVRINEISKAITCTPREAVDACHVNPDALSTPSSAFVSRLSKLKTAAPGANCCSMFLSAPKLFMGDTGDEWVSVVGRNAKLLREKFPNVDVDAVVEHDPELLVLSGLEEAVEELLSLWTAEAFALSDVDNDFFAEELSVALRACAPNGGALPEMFS